MLRLANTLGALRAEKKKEKERVAKLVEKQNILEQTKTHNELKIIKTLEDP